MCLGPLPHGHPLGKRFPRKTLGKLVYLLWPNKTQSPASALETHRQQHDQFFALDRVCGAYPKNSRQQPQLLPGADASAIHGRTERSGCTAAEPYPLSRSYRLSLRQHRDQQDKNNDLKTNPQGLTAILIAGWLRRGLTGQWRFERLTAVFLALAPPPSQILLRRTGRPTALASRAFFVCLVCFVVCPAISGVKQSPIGSSGARVGAAMCASQNVVC